MNYGRNALKRPLFGPVILMIYGVFGPTSQIRSKILWRFLTTFNLESSNSPQSLPVVKLLS
ncbi:hypothetical protein HOLleu_10772 [Holothuria leucospilota]|uniref:Uncharacterized protein n=1 Tax=Holothuria leucospilota TaxID=206669 RepID=A0A9Q1CFC1_HOLLE|nr:hypothetical protein HOLleu_10772 [Holothuria leucospilota]